MTDDAANAEFGVVGDAAFLAALADTDGLEQVHPVGDHDPAAVVYDLDGTLVRLLVDWQRLERELGERLEAAGLRDPGGDVWSRYDVAVEHGLREEFEALIAERERDGARESIRLPAADVVGSEGVPVGVCSLNSERACRIALAEQDLAAHVGAVVGRDSVATRKPDPEPLWTVCEALDVDPAETLFVGDSESDAECADRAGTMFRYVEGEPTRPR
ncbi:MAG: HAD family hydrolase [Haloferacaceae archaeon]